MSKLTPEQESLLALSCMVWARRDQAKAAGLSFNEETITETILLDLKTSYPGHVQIVAFNKAREATTGADWLWSFVSADQSQSLTILVQAKRLEDAERTYPGINRNIGNRTPPVRQIDQLLATARRQNVPAIYAFYNHVTNMNRVPRNCGSLPSADLLQVFGFGISLAEASTVAGALPNEMFDVHSQHSIPLHCLLCTSGSGAQPSGGTPERVVSGLARLRSLATSREGRDPDDLGLQQGLHPMVEFAVGLAARRADGGDFPVVDGPPNIAGVVVLRDTKREVESESESG